MSNKSNADTDKSFDTSIEKLPSGITHINLDKHPGEKMSLSNKPIFKCPSCNTQLNVDKQPSVNSSIGNGYLYKCPSCKNSGSCMRVDSTFATLNKAYTDHSKTNVSCPICKSEFKKCIVEHSFLACTKCNVDVHTNIDCVYNNQRPKIQEKSKEIKNTNTNYTYIIFGWIALSFTTIISLTRKE